LKTIAKWVFGNKKWAGGFRFKTPALHLNFWGVFFWSFLGKGKWEGWGSKARDLQ
jgi:hypothetical protein